MYLAPEVTQRPLWQLYERNNGGNIALFVYNREQLGTLGHILKLLLDTISAKSAKGKRKGKKETVLNSFT